MRRSLFTEFVSTILIVLFASNAEAQFRQRTRVRPTAAVVPVVLTTASLPSVPEDTSINNLNITLQCSGGTGPYTYQVNSGMVPAGVSLNPATGLFTGTPTTAGVNGVFYTCTDSLMVVSAIKFLSWEITATASLPAGWGFSDIGKSGSDTLS